MSALSFLKRFFPGHQGSRLLVLMSDNRTPETDKDKAAYHSLVTYINAVYCKRHGYDFIYYQPYLSRSKYLTATIEVSAELIKPEPEKKKPCCYNSLLGQFRAAPWSKLVSLKHSLSLNYDTIVVIDSDCIFLDQDNSIKTFIELTPVISGVPFDKSSMGFLKNTPFGDNIPCSGFIVVKNCKVTTDFLTKWWNYPNEDKNFCHDYEQSSLLKIFDSHNDILSVWDSVSLLDEEGQFLRHFTYPHHESREPYFRRFVSRLEADGHGYFADVVSEVRANQFHRLDTCSVRWN